MFGGYSINALVEYSINALVEYSINAFPLMLFHYCLGGLFHYYLKSNIIPVSTLLFIRLMDTETTTI